MALFRSSSGSGSADRVAMGTYTANIGSTVTITCGFRPKKIFIYNFTDSTHYITSFVDTDVSVISGTPYHVSGWRNGSSSGTTSVYNVGYSGAGLVQSITDTGFTVSGSSVFPTRYYVATT